MMWWELFQFCLTAGAFYAATLCELQRRRLRRLAAEYERLDDLLTTAVVWAFLHQHLPIWLACERYSGQHFVVQIEDADSRQSGPPER